MPCAYGGAPLRWWNPEENGALLRNMLDMLDGLVPRAILWVQGEAEGYENSSESYLARFGAFVRHTREALGQPNLPFLTVQINRCVEGPSEALDRQWGMVREAQRQARYALPGVAVVPSADLALYDFIHNAAASNLVVGERCARAALAVCYGRAIDWEAPEPEEARLIAPDSVLLTFRRIRNWLNPYEVPPCELPFDAEDDGGLVHPSAYVTGTDCLTLTFPRPLVGRVRLHGAWRMNPGLAIPCDCMRLPMLSFYGFEVTRQEERP